ncbi:MAG TPA: SusD/RagB family nutrient-binding outer membrane lipoprotein [Prolixibacteraceae bacterium]
MKKIIIPILLIVALFSSCDKWIDPNINVDPNNPTDVAMAQLVAPIEANLAYIVGGELARWDCVWMQQIAGIQSQSAENDIYIYNESDANNAWGYNLYSPGMIDAKILMNKAVVQKSPHYAGIGKILMAYQLGVTTDHWGDIPYSEAFKGTEGKYKPKYDSQESIYDTIFSLLNTAIVNLDAPTSLFSPDAEDIIYLGDLAKWKMTAYALLARYNMHLEKRRGATVYANALAAITNSYTSNDDDLKVVFGTAYNNSNPIYQSEQERSGYYSASATYMDMLTAANDPRKAVYFNGTLGSKPGEPNADAATIGTNYASDVSPVYLMSYVEVKFIEAEASFKTNNTARAATAYNDGLKASLQREGVYDDAWYTAHTETAATITLEKIMDQKYLSSFLSIETWTDWRRTGFPVLKVATGAVINQIPRRLLYPLDDRLYNGENQPTGLTLTDRVWWDVAN